MVAQYRKVLLPKCLSSEVSSPVIEKVQAGEGLSYELDGKTPFCCVLWYFNECEWDVKTVHALHVGALCIHERRILNAVSRHTFLHRLVVGLSFCNLCRRFPRLLQTKLVFFRTASTALTANHSDLQVIGIAARNSSHACDPLASARQVRTGKSNSSYLHASE